MSQPSAARKRATGSMWALAWTWPLIGPAGAALAGDVPHPGLALLGLALFLVLYVVVVTDAFDDQHPKATRADLVMLMALAAVGITLVSYYGDRPNGWLNLVLYIAVAGAATLSSPLAALWSISIVGVLTGYAFGANIHDNWSDVAQIAFGVLLASALVHTMKQMLRYIRILRVTQTQLAHAAVTEERLRFARDLHDLLGHSMSLIVVKAEVVRRLVGQDAQLAASAAADIEQIGRHALAEVRQAVDGYRAPDLPGELATVRGALRDVGVQAQVTQSGAPLPRVVSDVFAWAVREASTNVIRHSGATTCEITVEADDREARVTVRDNGRGDRAKGPESTGVGLVGLRERLAAVGGTLDTGHRPGGGFELAARVPVSAWPDPSTPDSSVAELSAPDPLAPGPWVPGASALVASERGASGAGASAGPARTGAAGDS